MNLLADVWQPLIVCDPTGSTDASGAKLPDCDFNALIHLIKNAITDLTILATLATVLACIFIGFNLMTASARGDSGAIGKARSRAIQILIGYFLIVGAWIIVYAVASVLFTSDYSHVLKP